MARLLFVVSSATEMALADGSPHEIGYWPEEVYRPLHRYLEAEVDVVVATPDGEAPTPDPLGLGRASTIATKTKTSSLRSSGPSPSIPRTSGSPCITSPGSISSPLGASS